MNRLQLCDNYQRPSSRSGGGLIMKFQRNTLHAACLTAIVLLLCACTTLPVTSTLPEKARRLADTIVSQYGTTSVQYAIIDNGRILLSGSSGVFSKDSNRQVAPHDIYGIGSTSKMFAAASAMVLRDRGLLDLDCPVTAYIPEFTMADPRYADITPRMLLNHSSGLYGSSFANTFLFDDVYTVAHDTILDKLAAQRLRAAPGELSEYCNDGFTLIELLVERITGISYTEFITETFLIPLGMDDTRAPGWDFDKDAHMARVYLPTFDCAMPHDTVNALATGGLYSTAEDLCRFAEVLMGSKPDILSEESTLMMQQEEFRKGLWVDEPGDNLFAYGLGWDSVHGYPFGTYGIHALTKGGDTQLFHSSLVVVPEYRIAMAVISSGGASAINYACAATTLQMLMREKGIIDQPKSPKSLVGSTPVAIPDELQAYAGIYANNLSTIVMAMEGNLLTATHTDGRPQETYAYLDDGRFQNSDTGISLKFVQPEDDRIFVQQTQLGVLPGLGELLVTEFKYQKIESVPVSRTVLEAWNTRIGLRYFVVSEKPSSQAYAQGDSIVQSLNDDFSHGYAYAGIRIVDENFAENTLLFRDATDMEFETHDGVEYLHAGDLTYAREDSFPELNAYTDSCVIGINGYSRYLLVGADVEDKTLIADIPDGGAIAVYDHVGNCIWYSTVCSTVPPVLPPAGKVVFIGSPGDVFGIAYE